MKTLELISSIISIAVFYQGIETLWIYSSWANDGIWRWELLKKDYSNKTQDFLYHFLSERRFFALVLAQVIFAGINIFHPQAWILGFLLLSTSLTALRWRGSFNGGADYMTAVVLLGAFIASCFPESENVQLASFAYISVQVVLSYFLAGIAKAKQQKWRDGRAITEFALHSYYAVDPRTKRLAKKPFYANFAAKMILIFECTFPLALLDPRICLVYICIGFFFHLENYFILGLNRFLFAWLAAYPALYYVSKVLNE